MRPTGFGSYSSSGHTFVSSSGSKSSLGVLAVGHDLHAKLPLRVLACLDGGAEVLGVGAEVVGLDGRGVGGGPAAHALLGDPVVLDEHRLVLLVDPLVGVYAFRGFGDRRRSSFA